MITCVFSIIYIYCCAIISTMSLSSLATALEEDTCYCHFPHVLELK
jgi:hypothetical protein